MDPYVSDPDSIPVADMYADVPFYGRYFPRSDDFRIDPQHINSQSVDSLKYWASVLDLCDESVRIYPADEDGRDVFTLGSIIVKSSHLHETKNGQPTEIDYSYADANELQAVDIAKGVLKDVRVPDIYFAGKVSALELRHYATNHLRFLDQRSPSASPRKTPRRWYERRMAVLIAGPKGIIQTAGGKYTPTATHYKTPRQTPYSQACCPRSKYSH